jgi:7,8-dihydropterin-6-yl-methyl-4-(beta-D-ribofuranosyl)aminobenzene 5'-phosphate synthase
MVARLSPLWWPVLVASSPVLAVKLWRDNQVFQRDLARAEKANQGRIDRAMALDLPELDFIDLTIMVEYKTSEGFRSDPGVSYLVRTDRGALLFDMGFGSETPTLAHNAARLNAGLDEVDALVISHLHPDHMGGTIAFKSRTVRAPRELNGLRGKPCYLPDVAEAGDFRGEVVLAPRLLAAGVGTTGPLARSLFFHGLCEEQALVARIRGKGLVVITGCGHPTVEVILDMVRRLSEQPIYAIAGGLHFPLSESRSKRRGIQVQMFLGTGKPPWRRINDEDLSRTIARINAARVRKILISAHDSCDHALERLRDELDAETTVLVAGATYRL